MAIERIDYELCNNCKVCIDSCPLDILRFDEEKEQVYIQYQEECMCCFNCELDCAKDAIYVSPYRKVPVMHPWG